MDFRIKKSINYSDIQKDAKFSNIVENSGKKYLTKFISKNINFILLNLICPKK